MKIAFLACHGSIHTVKWLNEMASRGHKVHLITSLKENNPIDSRVTVHVLPFKPPFGYYLNAPFLKSLLNRIKPDLLNTHYASGYGTLARLSGFQPNLLSVWGSDVLDFPYQSRRKMKIVQKNIASADRVAATSYLLKRHTELIQRPEKEIAITPFGVDCELFSPADYEDKDHKNIRIGTVKGLAPQYGISHLIKAYAHARKNGLINSELYLVGSGPSEKELKSLVADLDLIEEVYFVGTVPHKDVPLWMNSFDIFVALSERESFGVSVLEASACGLPVIVSDAGGLPEVVIDRETGFIVPVKDHIIAAKYLIALSRNQELRRSMGIKGREFVFANFEWSNTADNMEQLYKNCSAKN